MAFGVHRLRVARSAEAAAPRKPSVSGVEARGRGRGRSASLLVGTLDVARASIDSPGASAAVLVPGQPLWVGTSGLADVHSHRPVTPGTLFEIASVTKTLMA